MARKQKTRQEQETPQESVYDAVLQKTLKKVSDFEKKIVALYCEDMPERYMIYDPNYHVTRIPVFMMTGIRIPTPQGFIFEAEQDLSLMERLGKDKIREKETFPEWYPEWYYDPLNDEIYLGIDVRCIL